MTHPALPERTLSGPSVVPEQKAHSLFNPELILSLNKALCSWTGGETPLIGNMCRYSSEKVVLIYLKERVTRMFIFGILFRTREWF